jgi:two-component system response regulator FixJ
MTTTLAVHIVEDDDDVRDSMVILLRANGFKVREHASPRDFFENYSPDEAGCIILDMMLPELTGDQVHERLTRLGDTPPIIMVTGQPAIRMAVDAMKRGAIEFMEKPVNTNDLIETVRRCIARRFEDMRKRDKVVDAQARIDVLTPRERDVLRQLLRGRPNKIIARELGLSPRTVEIHRARVMEKTGAGSLPTLVKLAMVAGIDL